MQPVAESSRADELYGPFVYEDQDLLERLVELSHEVRSIVPECFGMSLSLQEHGVTFTAVATDQRVALLDAAQYVESGPCTQAIEEGAVVDASDPASMSGWAVFASMTRGNGVGSTLSLPLKADHTTLGGYNLYASVPRAFDGHHGQLAEVLGAWSQGAVSDADLRFASLDRARRAPRLLRESTQLAVVAARLAAARGLTVEEAEERLRQASVRAAVPLPTLVSGMLEVLD